MCFSGVPRNLRNDLLVAADSITNTMSSLVKELHSGQFILHLYYYLNHVVFKIKNYIKKNINQYYQ